MALAPHYLKAKLMSEKPLRSAADLPKPESFKPYDPYTSGILTHKLNLPPPPPGYKPKRPRTPKTIKWNFCRNCYKDLPETKPTRGRNQEFCSEKCRVAYGRAIDKSFKEIANHSFETASQLEEFEKLGFSEETLDILERIAVNYPKSQALEYHLPWSAAELAAEALYREGKPDKEKVIELYGKLIKMSEKLGNVEKELAESKEEIKRLKAQKGVVE